MGFQGAPTLYIESIVVENLSHVSEKLILTRARLREGTAYAEAELAEAIGRIRQLPFIRNARLSIKKGSRRNAYQLVVWVEESRIYLLNSETRYLKIPHRKQSSQDQGFIGIRHFLGSHALAYASWTPDRMPTQDSNPNYNFLSAGYSHFNLLGKGLVFNGEFTWREAGALGENDGVSNFAFRYRPKHELNLELGVPLKRNQWLRTIWSAEKERRDLEFFRTERSPLLEGLGSRYTKDHLSGILQWEHNSSNDSWEPTKGWQLRLGIGLARTKAVEIVELPIGIDTFREWRTRDFFGAGAYYHPIGRRQALQLSGSAFFERIHENFQDDPFVELRRREFDLSLGYRASLVPPAAGGRWGNLVLGLEVGAGYFQNDLTDLRSTGFETHNIERDRYAEAYLAYRGSWMLLRLSFRYRHLDRDFSAFSGGGR